MHGEEPWNTSIHDSATTDNTRSEVKLCTAIVCAQATDEYIQQLASREWLVNPSQLDQSKQVQPSQTAPTNLRTILLWLDSRVKKCLVLWHRNQASQLDCAASLVDASCKALCMPGLQESDLHGQLRSQPSSVAEGFKNFSCTESSKDVLEVTQRLLVDDNALSQYIMFLRNLEMCAEFQAQ